MLQLILITFLFCANNKGQPVAAPEVLGDDQDPRGQGSGQVGGDVSQASNIWPCWCPEKIQGASVFNSLVSSLLFSAKPKHSWPHFCSARGGDWQDLSHLSCPFSLAGCRQNPSFMGPLGNQYTMLGAEQAPRKAGWFPASGDVEWWTRTATQKPTVAPCPLTSYPPSCSQAGFPSALIPPHMPGTEGSNHSSTVLLPPCSSTTEPASLLGSRNLHNLAWNFPTSSLTSSLISVPLSPLYFSAFVCDLQGRPSHPWVSLHSTSNHLCPPQSLSSAPVFSGVSPLNSSCC